MPLWYRDAYAIFRWGWKHTVSLSQGHRAVLNWRLNIFPDCNEHFLSTLLSKQWKLVALQPQLGSIPGITQSVIVKTEI